MTTSKRESRKAKGLQMTFLTSILLFKLVLALVTLSIPVGAAIVVHFDHKAEKLANARRKAVFDGGALSYK